MSLVQIGKNVQQKEGFSAFIPNQFPPKGGFVCDDKIIKKLNNIFLFSND